jgi:hypothetical protein
MADRNESEPPHTNREMLPVSAAGSAAAPMLYFEDAPTFGHMNGIIQVTLEAVRLYSEPPGVKRERVVVAHMRMNIPAARSLRAALDGALLIAAPSESHAKN